MENEVKILTNREEIKEIFFEALKEYLDQTYAKENPAPPYCTTKEAAFILNISMTTLWRMVKRGELTPIVVGKKRLFDRAKIEHYQEYAKGA